MTEIPSPDTDGATQAAEYRALDSDSAIERPEADTAVEIEYALTNTLRPAAAALESYGEDIDSITKKLDYLTRAIKEVAGATNSSSVESAGLRLFPELPDPANMHDTEDIDSGRTAFSGERQMARHMHDLIRDEDSLEQARIILHDYIEAKITTFEEYLAELNGQNEA